MVKRLSMAFGVLLLWAASARMAHAQQPLTEVLSFLLINRSIPTGDFSRDEQAAAATRDAIVSLLQAELGTLPTNSPASGFSYRLDPSIGANVRTSRNFGPFFMERSLTSGRQISLGLGYTQADFNNIDGRPLRDGTLVGTASRLAGEAQPFDAETLTLRVSMRILAITGQFGLTDRLDVGATLPFVRVDFSGTRIDTYRGTALVQATAAGSTSGLGDLILRSKYNLVRLGGSGLSAGADVRLPTGDARNLLGGGDTVFTPRLIGSFERDRVAAHGQIGLAVGGVSKEIDAGGAVTMAATSRLTVIGEILVRRLSSGGRLTDVSEPHPTLAGVTTLRLSATQQATTRTLLVAGFRWNVASRWLFSTNVLRPVTSAGLNSRWVASATFDYSLGG